MRRHNAEKENAAVYEINIFNEFYGNYEVESRQWDEPYRVEIRSLDEHLNSCSYPDFYMNQLGTCKPERKRKLTPPKNIFKTRNNEMMNIIYICLLIILGLLHTGQVCATPDSPTVPPFDFSNLDSLGLVQRLKNPAECSSAFYELHLRNHYRNRSIGRKDLKYDKFCREHYGLEAIVCPQPDDKPPIYVVLSGFLNRSTPHQIHSYTTDNLQQLFGAKNKRALRNQTERCIYAFTITGKRICLFKDAYTLSKHGYFQDINGDGVIERVDQTKHFIRGVDSISLLRIWAIHRQAQPIFSVVYNWGKADWDCELSDPDKDGVFDINLGVRNGTNFQSKVVYRWNPGTKSYIGPRGNPGDHFRVIDPDHIQTALRKLRQQNTVFPIDTDFAGTLESHRDPWSRSGLKKPTTEDLSHPYHYHSLKNLSEAELTRYMGRGKNMYELENDAMIKSHIPTNFMRLDPKVAAMEMAQQNRYPDHKHCYQLAIDDRDGLQPPEACSVSFSRISSGCFCDIYQYCFLRADPTNSYFAYAQPSKNGAVYYNFINGQPVYDFRQCTLPYETAKQFVQTIWWLDRIRSLPAAPSRSFGWKTSTSDGYGTLVLRDANGKIIVERSAIIWSDHISQRWRAGYTPETFMNMSKFMITKAIPDFLGPSWKEENHTHSHSVFDTDANTPAYTPKELSCIRELATGFIDYFSPDQTMISYEILDQAIKAAGELNFTNLKPRLEKILESLPTGSHLTRTYSEIRAELEDLKMAKYPSSEYDKIQTHKKELQAEMDDFRSCSGCRTAADLRKDISLSIKKMEAANNPQHLYPWACSTNDGFQWAMHQLSKVNEHEYASALAYWMKNSKESWPQRVYGEIAKNNPQLASEIAEKLPENLRNPPVSKLEQLKKINNIPDEKERIQALIKAALDTREDWYKCCRAIDFLVPPEEPLRYSDKHIDQALQKLFDSKLSDNSASIIISESCKALALRNRIDLFDKMAAKLDTVEEPMLYQGILRSMVLLSLSDKKNHKPRILKIVKPHLTRTNKNISQIMWVIWAADLRELKPRLEELATSSPTDYQAKRAYSSGGVATPVTGRYHIARKIVSIWNEEDPVTRRKMLTILKQSTKHAPCCAKRFEMEL